MTTIPHISTLTPNTGIVPPWLVAAQNTGIVPPKLQVQAQQQTQAKLAVTLLTH